MALDSTISKYTFLPTSMSFLTLIFVYSLLVSGLSVLIISEEDRVREWRSRHGVWPPVWQNETAEYRDAMRRQLDDIMTDIPALDERWNSWIQHVQGRLIPSFTPRGFEIIKTPHSVHKIISNYLSRYLSKLDRYEEETWMVNDVYYEPGKRQKFLQFPRDLGEEVLVQLKPYMENWSGIELVPVRVYGIRAYRDGASLAMHHDKVENIIVSAIVHVSHSYSNDSEPWPIEIEDHSTGRIQEMNLQVGETLFYESAKCLHGRRRKLKGHHYASLFVHYMPLHRDEWGYKYDDLVYAVPPNWHDGCVEKRGSRYSGEAITTNELIADGAPPRVVGSIDSSGSHSSRGLFTPPLFNTDNGMPPPEKRDISYFSEL